MEHNLDPFVPDPPDEAFDLHQSIPKGRKNSGFPSPATDFLEDSIDLNRVLIQRPNSTFYARVSGEDMQGFGVHDGDILMIDKSLSLQHEDLIVVHGTEGFAVRKVRVTTVGTMLCNDEQEVSLSADDIVWGVVIHLIRSLR